MVQFGRFRRRASLKADSCGCYYCWVQYPGRAIAVNGSFEGPSSLLGQARLQAHWEGLWRLFHPFGHTSAIAASDEWESLAGLPSYFGAGSWCSCPECLSFAGMRALDAPCGLVERSNGQRHSFSSIHSRTAGWSEGSTHQSGEALAMSAESICRIYWVCRLDRYRKGHQQMGLAQMNYLTFGTSQSRQRRGHYQSSSAAARTDSDYPFGPSQAITINSERGATAGLSAAQTAFSSSREGDGRVLC